MKTFYELKVNGLKFCYCLRNIFKTNAFDSELLVYNQKSLFITLTNLMSRIPVTVFLKGLLLLVSMKVLNMKKSNSDRRSI